LFLRKPLLAWMRSREVQRPEVDSIVGQTAVLLEPVSGNAVAKAELRGTSWSARSVNGAALAAGARCRVARVDGLTLWLEAD
jgi:membrane protein implicated in regulation of membrane protease activity